MFNKKINTGLIALLIGASAAFAFNAPAKKAPAKLAVQWFSYNGGGINNPANYSELPGLPGCDGSGTLCAIEAPEDGNTGKPTQAGVNNPVDTRLKP